ncbi:hypothetical protein [Aquirhabdus parva]|nr:hypothetical protein [Aquirhabdus parva]
MDTLVVQAIPQPRVYAGQDLSPPYVLNGHSFMLGCSPWPSQPDLLCYEHTFYGLTYNVALESLDDVKHWVSSIGSDRIRLVKMTDSNYYDAAVDHLSSGYCLELLWAHGEPNRVIYAGLSEDSWLYQMDLHNSGNVFDAIFGVMLVAVADIANEFGLQLPDRFV